MIYLLLSILSSSIIFVVFKLFKRFEVNTLQAIIVNYFIACSVGYFGFVEEANITEIPSKPWFYGTLILGLLFIIVFNLAAITTQRSGLSVVSVATKMSVAIPVLFGILYFNESTGILKIIGIFLALIAVYLSSIKARTGIAIKKKNLVYPILVFIGSGLIDTLIKFIEAGYVNKTDVALFSSTIFSVAGTIGILVLIFQGFTGNLKITGRNILGGIALGIPNFFSIYFLVMALRNNGFESSTIFTINNVAIVLVSTLLGIILFKERLITKNWIGIILAIISILLVANSGI
ncbi:EamA-like transporter family protein [Gillisia mitskevichiae]|uniref:EamA-like transporter family protein n=1 Tax=Gillisia mitskevichiae TaxID=270921 RepID=A0A495PJ73_9FLAO|nr:EamA family transporter [Gillisia mitskevichiae]RKS50774.1 EamA-like transporter family protein [Gillisia mitskevichiae]